MIHDLANCTQCKRVNEQRELDVLGGICYTCYIKNTHQETLSEYYKRNR